jgi:hypothetical protein
MEAQQARSHHYVPQWYQKRFLEASKNILIRYDLTPEKIAATPSKGYVKNKLHYWPTQKCFCVNDLYMLRFGQQTTDLLERWFFGEVDKKGASAVATFGRYQGFTADIAEAFNSLVPYMGAQRFRTPRGLDWIKTTSQLHHQNDVLTVMQRVFQQHTTMWAEGIWEIVGAHHSPTKFIISDSPITFYNRLMSPRDTPYPGTEELPLLGTRTLFPLGPETCLIITHTQLTRNPDKNPLVTRENARSYEMAMKNMLDTQFGRELENDEVLKINLILKRKATRFIASPVKEWLYPERYVSTTEWRNLDDDWFLMPHLWKVGFTTGIIMGWEDGSSWAVDEYGRRPWHPKYKDEKNRSIEHETRHRAQREWAKKRVGRAVAHVVEHDEVHDRMMHEYLKMKGLE